MWRKSTLQHFDLGAIISSLLKTLPLPLPLPPTDSDSAGHVGCIDGRGRGRLRPKSHTTCVGTTFEFKRTSRLLKKYVLYSMNEGSMNGIRTYYIRHVYVVTCHASSQQRENLKSPLYCANIETGVAAAWSNGRA